MATKAEPEVQAVYNRIYHRHDIQGPAIGWKVALAVLLIWGLFGVFNVLFLSGRIEDQRQRVIRSFVFGPAFVPLKVGQGEPVVEIGSTLIPINAAKLIGFLPLALAGVCLFAGQETRDRRNKQRYLAQKYATTQGRLMPGAAKQQLRLTGPGIPLALLDGVPIGIPQGKDAGHIAVIAPTRSGKGLHLTEALLRWEGPAVVVDPKQEQWERTAGSRGGAEGVAYQLPRDGIDLLTYYNVHDPLDLQELHAHLMKTKQDRDAIFAEKTLPLFQAAAITSKATGAHALQLLARWAALPAAAALTEAAQHAPEAVERFANSTDFTDLGRFAQSSWETFTTRFAPYLPHIKTVTTPTIPRDWLMRGASIYICYPLDQLAAASGLIAAIVGGLLKGQMRQHEKIHTLYAIDEAPTVAIYNLDTHLSTVGGYGVTMLLYIQSLSQLDENYGVHRARTILGNCHYQLYYPPRDPFTERHIADMFGTELYFTESESVSHGADGKTRTAVNAQQHYRPALEHASTLPPGVVAIIWDHYRVVAERLNPLAKLPTLPPPPEFMRVGAEGWSSASMLSTATPAPRSSPQMGTSRAAEAPRARPPAGETETFF